MTEKPPYRVPSMAEIAASPKNGLNVVSTFSGCGGSCLGFEMAGYRVAWASEFVPAAAETYRLNHPDVPLSTADIREVEPEAILAETGLRPGDVDVVEGSPPCASFSSAGKGSRHWGESRKYSDVEQRVDDLFFEFARIVRGLQPRAFVAENVAGLARGVAKGYFKQIHRALVEAGYRVEARMLDAQWLGVPQVRRRVIFVGIRNDVDANPVFPKPLPYRYTITDALPWIVRQASNAPYGERGWNDAERSPSQTIGASPQTGNGLSPPSLVEVRTSLRSSDDVGDFTAPSLEGFAVGDEWDKLGRGEASERYFNLVRPDVDEPLPTVTQRGGGSSVASVTHPTERRKFTIAELRRVCGFPDDFALTGSYAQRWERLGRAVPPVMMAAIARELATALRK